MQCPKCGKLLLNRQPTVSPEYEQYYCFHCKKWHLQKIKTCGIIKVAPELTAGAEGKKDERSK